ncbi:MAG: tRNA-dihydrouridine synthase family protein [bacterium]|nr:tRNA-dihydrouridine synthase family protein [bacterium]
MKIALAPMDGITDLAYRTICKELFETHGNPDDELMLRTEFMSADGYVINPPGVIKHLRKTDFEPQLIAQIFGGNGETLLKCAMDIEKTYKFAGVEINMGCPSPGVMKCAAGSAMLKDKVNALKILKTISQQLNLPLSLKTRVGLSEDDKDEQFQFLLEISQYVRMISVHGRTYKQSHSGEVDREFIWRLKQKLPDKVIIGNGGIRSYDDAKQHYSP